MVGGEKNKKQKKRQIDSGKYIHWKKIAALVYCLRVACLYIFYLFNFMCVCTIWSLFIGHFVDYQWQHRRPQPTNADTHTHTHSQRRTSAPHIVVVHAIKRVVQWNVGVMHNTCASRIHRKIEHFPRFIHIALRNVSDVLHRSDVNHMRIGLPPYTLVGWQSKQRLRSDRDIYEWRILLCVWCDVNCKCECFYPIVVESAT